MNFLNPLYLIFLPAVFIPVAIHLLNRSKVKKVAFPTLMFLSPATKRVIRRYRLLQLLLMFLRVLVVLAVTLAFSRPVWRGYGKDDESIYSVILIDNSFSMGSRIGRDDALEEAKAAAAYMVKEIGGQFAVGVFNRRLTGFAEFTGSGAEAAKELDSVKLSCLTTDIPGSLKEMLGRLRDDIGPEVKKNIIIFSDFNRDAFPDEAAGADMSDVNLFLADVSDAGSNIWVRAEDCDVAYSGIPAHFRVPVHTTGRAGLRLVFFSEDVKRASRPVAPGSDAELEFIYRFPSAGVYRNRVVAEASGESDRIKEDSSYYFMTRVLNRIDILAVDGDPGYTALAGESYFAVKALTTGDYSSSSAVRVVTPGEFLQTDTSGYDVLFLLNVEMNSRISEKAYSFSDSGKGIAIFLGSNTIKGGYGKFISDLMPVRLQGNILRDIAGKLEFPGPFFSGMGKESLSGSGKMRVIGSESSSNLRPAVSVSGTPLLWLYAPELNTRGKAALFTSAADMDWGPFPLNPVYPVIISETAKFLGLPQDTGIHSCMVGDPRPDGTGFYQKPGNFISGNASAGRYVSVNLDTGSGESKLERMAPGDIKRRFSARNVDYIPFSDNIKGDVLRAVKGQEKSHIFLFAAVMLLAAEEMLRKYIKRHES